MAKKRAFGELELAILHILKSRQKMTVREVHEALGGKDKYTTIMTVMSRLAEKKELERCRAGLQYEYWIASSDQSTESRTSIIDRLRQRIFGGKSFAMISYLIEAGHDLTPEELNNMEQLIIKAKQAKKGS